ncbi:MAG: AlbA family DNA-binding domain-containing protein, partial [Candidatus Hodarchaeales archaeon]
MPIDTLSDIFSLKQGNPYLIKRESNGLEYKKAFHFASLAEYARDFAAFANRSGGYIVFGVQDRPHIPVGLNNSSFADTDEAKITEFVDNHFSPSIEWERETYNWDNKLFGIIYIHEARNKPIIATNSGGKNQEIKSGEIYFRYIARTEKIKYAELTEILEERIRQESNRWRELFEKIAEIGPQNATILDTIEGKIEEGKRTILIDNEIVNKIKFIREGHFTEKEGAVTLKLIGEVHPVSVVGHKADVLHDNPYKYRATDVAEEVAKSISQLFRVQPEHVKCWKYYNIRGTYTEGKAKCN